MRIAGFLIYLILSMVNRFIVPIPYPVYIPLALIGIALIIADFVKSRKRRG